MATEARYEILHPMEEGPDVRVFAARDRESGRRRVLTLLPEEYGEPERHWDRLRSLRHPLVVPVLDLGFRARRPGLITPWLREGPLLSGPLHSISDRLTAVLRLCELTAYLHARGILRAFPHPGKLFADSRRMLVANLAGSEGRGAEGLSERAIRYAAPEILRGAAPDRSSDLYTLGMTAYHILTGTPPFLEDDPAALRQRAAVALPADVRKLNAEIPEPAAEAVRSLVQKDPSLRPDSAQAVTRAFLEAWRSLGTRPARAAGFGEDPFKAPLTGRRREMETLSGLIERVGGEGRSKLLVVRGVAGIGKSRLVEHLGAKARLARWEVRADEPDGAIKNLFAGDTPLLFICSPPPRAEDQWEALLRAVRSSRRPLLAVGEQRLGEGGDGWPPSDLVGREDRVEVLTLGPLKREDAARLLQAMVAGAPAELSCEVLSKALGNPFFVEEFLLQRLRGGDLRYEYGRWRYHDRTGGRGSPPRAVLERILEPFRTLQESEREIVEVLAAAESPLSLAVLAEVLERPPEEVERQLRSLSRLEIAELSGGFEGALASLHHVWAGPALRKSVDGKRLRQLHSRLARQFERRLCPHANSALLLSLVNHALEAGDAPRVRRYIQPAVKRLREDSLFHEAASLLGRAAQSGLLEEPLWKIQSQRLDLLYRSGETESCSRLAKRLLTEEFSRPPARKAWLLGLLGRIRLLRGETSRAIEALEGALPCLARIERLDLDNEIRSELLGALVYSGRFEQAGHLARHLLSERSGRTRAASFDKVCHALFLYLHHVKGATREAVSWESRSIRLALRAGQLHRAAGRLLGLALAHAETGRPHRAESLLRFVRSEPSMSRNTEIDIFARHVACVLLRRQGRHEKAVRRLGELLARNQRISRSRNIESGLHVELARNYNALLQPERALESLRRCRALLEKEYKFDDAVDASLEEARSHLILGRLKQAKRALDAFSWNLIPLRQVAAAVLHARILSGEQRPSEALQLLDKSLPNTASERPEESIQARLAEGCILLELGRTEEALQAGRQAGRMAAQCRDEASRAQAFLLRSRCLSENPRRARALAVRALQIASRLEDRDLFASAFRQAGRASAQCGRTQEARRFFSHALRDLKRCLFRLSGRHREGFSNLRVRPVERERERCAPVSPSGSAGRHLIQLRRFCDRFDPRRPPSEWAEALLKDVAAGLPAAGRVYWRASGGKGFQLTASLGHCLKSGRRFLSQNGAFPPESHSLRWEESADVAELALPLGRSGNPRGLLYLECPIGAVSEAEIDFLLCLRDYLELSLQARGRGQEPSAAPAVQSGADQEIIGQDPRMRRVLEQTRRVAPSSAAVLISGESGTGKELLAQAVHRFSRRRRGPFVPINCSGLPETLIETELFGHAQGSFTGAGRDKAGLFEAAHGGTLFLDEIGSMPKTVQRSLLRALQEGRIRRVGETRERPVDVRIVSATNRPLAELVRKGEFRRDLYHRLNVCTLEVPPLRERPGDIPLLARHFLSRLRRREGRSVHLSRGALQALASYHFPGNVRELQNLLESAFHLADQGRIRASDLRSRLESRGQGDSFGVPQRLLEEIVEGGDFWSAVREPFLARDLSRREVRRLISLGLSQCDGHYRRLVEHFNLPPSDYKRFLAFLSNHDLKVDFRPYRKSRATARQ